jgi:glycosyltransferase involved in cell wall biosynthesis
MKYTVIVPVFNSEDTIGDCIKSLLNQKGVTLGNDYSILVVDDGSTDRTPQIVESFPVRLIRLPENRGRIIARLTGAKNAETQRILFVDSRITISDDTIYKLDCFDGRQAVIGETDPAETKYDSPIHTVLYLIRRKYYGKMFFPITQDLLITEKNFKRSPKGTALLLIDKDLFIKLTPERTGGDVSDDTLLFHNLIYQHKIEILRSRKLFFRYSLRTDPKQFAAWLSHRGILFSDFYLRPGGYFHIPFVLVAAVVALLFFLALVQGKILSLAVAGVAIDGAISLYLCENSRDFIRVFLGLPLISLIFGSGIAIFWARLIRGSLSRLIKVN